MSKENSLADKIDKATMPLSGIMSQLGFLKGKVLTIIDASISDERQNKALKDLIKNAFYEQQSWITKVTTGEYGLVGTMGKLEEESLIEEINGKDI